MPNTDAPPAQPEAKEVNPVTWVNDPRMPNQGNLRDFSPQRLAQDVEGAVPDPDTQQSVYGESPAETVAKRLEDMSPEELARYEVAREQAELEAAENAALSSESDSETPAPQTGEQTPAPQTSEPTQGNEPSPDEGKAASS